MTPELNKEQYAAAHAPETPLLIIAGAGTGKTKTLVARIVHLIQTGTPPEQICALTFTNKAAREMEGRIFQELGQTPANGRPWMGTFHAFGASFLRAYAPEAHRTRDFVILDDHDSFELMKRILGKGTKKESISFFARRVGEVKNGTRDIEDLETTTGPGRPSPRAFYDLYENELRAHNAFDFDDLLFCTVRALESNPDIRARVSARYSHVLVDEYQDINPIQHHLLECLARDHLRLTVVGDANQTIYTWRGSDINLFLDFPRAWPGARTIFLSQNYRSTGSIIAAASPLAQSYDWGDHALRTDNADGDLVELYAATHDRDEAHRVATTIARDTHPASIAILYRTNAQSRAFEQALVERGIPYAIYGGLRFYERREIKDLLAGVRVMLNPEDTLARARLEKTFGKRASRALAEHIIGTATEAPHILLSRFLEASNYLALVGKTMDRVEERIENIDELLRFSKDFQSASALLEHIALVGATDAPTSTQEGIRRTPVLLMTIHLAKGLEFDTVFVVGCSEGTLPHARSYGDPAGIAEERRLLYVAMTRARKRLFLSFSDMPSRFLGEIPRDMLTVSQHTQSRFSGDPLEDDIIIE